MLTSLRLSHFRCFESLRLPLEPGMTLFFGDNAQGKTSILEAACVLLRLQSPRTSSLSELVHFGAPGFAVAGDLGDTELRHHYGPRIRKLLVDGETQASSGPYLRQSGLVVWMASDDLALVRSSAEGRRRYLDFMAAQLHPGYGTALRAYDRALRSRNVLLKRDAVPRWNEIDAYTRLLAEHGKMLTTLRRSLVERLRPHTAEAQRHISGREDEGLDLAYEAASGPGDDLAATLLARREEEVRRRQTVAGPHRDDLILMVQERSAAKFASEGQQRTVALALKLAQSRLFLTEKERAPVLLIDDVFGELDPGRRNALMAAWPEESQKLITTTHLGWLDAACGSPRRLVVSGGRVD